MIDEITTDDVLPYLDHVIMEFQLNDLRKASVDAKTNFLVAVGCMNTIEFLGGIRSELLGKENKDLNDQVAGGVVEFRFKEGVRLLKSEYYESSEV